MHYFCGSLHLSVMLLRGEFFSHFTNEKFDVNSNLGLTLGGPLLCSLILSQYMLLVRRMTSLIHWQSPEIHVMKTEIRARVGPPMYSNFWTKGVMEITSAPPQVKLSLLPSISLKIGPQGRVLPRVSGWVSNPGSNLSASGRANNLATPRPVNDQWWSKEKVTFNDDIAYLYYLSSMACILVEGQIWVPNRGACQLYSKFLLQ